MFTNSQLSRWSINYYKDTARQATQAGLDRRRANGGLEEYYPEGDVFRSDAAELFPDDHDVLWLRDQTVTLAELLTKHSPGCQPPRACQRKAGRAGPSPLPPACRAGLGHRCAAVG